MIMNIPHPVSRITQRDNQNSYNNAAVNPSTCL